MRSFLYFAAGMCALLAFVLLLYPIITTLGNMDSGLGLLITLGMVERVAPIAIALAVIPLCLAFANDQASREKD